jgi:hypothetical protein
MNNTFSGHITYYLIGILFWADRMKNMQGSLEIQHDAEHCTLHTDCSENINLHNTRIKQ